MNTSSKGRRAEYRVRTLLERAGYVVVRAAASKGPADLVAWNTTAIRFVSVKSGQQYASSSEREALRLLPRPACATVEIWRLPDRRPPIIEVLA